MVIRFTITSSQIENNELSQEVSSLEQKLLLSTEKVNREVYEAGYKKGATQLQLYKNLQISKPSNDELIAENLKLIAEKHQRL